MLAPIKRTTLYILLLIIVGTVIATALPFELAYSPIKESIYTNETAQYTFNITNAATTSDRIQIYTISSYWDVSPTLITVDANSTASFTLEVSALSDAFYGPQLVPLTIKSLQAGTVQNENLYVYVKSSNETRRTYSPNIASEVHLTNEIDPRNVFPIEIYLRNRNPLNITQLDIAIDSELFHKSYTTTLGPLEEKTNQVIFEINPLQRPGTYSVNIHIMVGNQTINDVSKDVYIKEYSDISIEETLTKTLFTTTERFVLINKGNYDVTKQVKTRSNFFQRIFTSSSDKYFTLNEDGVSYIAWNVPLKPEQKVQIVATTNYSILFIIAVIIIVCIILYYLFRSPVLIYKRAKITTETDQGVSELKVKLHIKNRSGRIIRNIKIIDRYPKIVDIEDESVLGSLKPTKMVSADKKHSVLMWNLELLEPYEERLVSYRLKSKLNIVGNVHLPSAKIRFQTKAGERTQLSNGVKLLHRSHHAITETDE